MKPSRVFWGVLFVVLGSLLIISRNFNVEVELDSVWKFWPLALIFIGLAFIFKNPLVKGILAAIAAIGIAFFLHGLTNIALHGPLQIEAGDEKDGNNAHVQDFSEPFSPSVTRASLKLEAAAGRYRIDTASTDLMSAHVRSSIGKFQLDRDASDGSVNLSLKPMSSFHVTNLKHLNHNVAVRLHPGAVWNLDLDVGAAQVECDLSGVRVENLSIDAGAASARVKVGLPVEEMRITINAGASSIRVAVPEEAGCEILVDGGLSSKKFVEFEKIRERVYQTANFDQSKQKIYIDADAGLANLRVVRY